MWYSCLLSTIHICTRNCARKQEHSRNCFTDTPPDYMITHTIDSYQIPSQQSNQDKVKVTNLKFFPKIQMLEFYKKNYTPHTFWSCLTRCINTKWIWLVLWKLQSRHHSVHWQMDERKDGLTDGQRTWNQYTPPFNFVEAGSLIK